MLLVLAIRGEEDLDEFAEYELDCCLRLLLSESGPISSSSSSLNSSANSFDWPVSFRFLLDIRCGLLSSLFLLLLLLLMLVSEYLVTGPFVPPCWLSMWRLRSTLRWNARPQVSQANGLNPECFRLWVIRLDDWLNDLPHITHLWGFSPVKKNMREN